ncbi:hypothetical protein LJR290_004912 [Variovorax sp. LjRoot290]|uniref:hypothetical protein n=1 Tax=Variovorax sp. LjRoot290 TaxID=3342316 RepID=UPI003ED15AE0
MGARRIDRSRARVAGAVADLARAASTVMAGSGVETGAPAMSVAAFHDSPSFSWRIAPETRSMTSGGLVSSPKSSCLSAVLAALSTSKTALLAQITCHLPGGRTMKPMLPAPRVVAGRMMTRAPAGAIH